VVTQILVSRERRQSDWASRKDDQELCFHCSYFAELLVTEFGKNLI
jgi:hypothetical protein